LTSIRFHLTIEDYDGPGVSEAGIARLAQRGTRLDESVNGHGLGLSITESITDQYGGQLILRRSTKLGGFDVEAILRLYVFPCSFLIQAQFNCCYRLVDYARCSLIGFQIK
jgi:signal transduction histidine kinase